MDRPFSNFSRRKARRQWTTGFTCAVLLVSGCQESSQIGRHDADPVDESRVPQRFHAPDDIRPVGQLVNHLNISEAESHVIENPFAGLHRFPPVPNETPAATPPQASDRETRSFDQLRLPFRLEKSSEAENSTPPPQPELSLDPPQASPREPQPSQPARPSERNRRSPVDAALQLNPPQQAATPSISPSEGASKSTGKPTAQQFLASLEPDAPELKGQELIGPEPPENPRLAAPSASAPRDLPEDRQQPAIPKVATPAENPALAPPSPQPQRTATPASPSSSFVKFRASDSPSEISADQAPNEAANPALVETPPERSVLEESAPQQPASGTSVVLPPHMRPLATVRQTLTTEDRALLAVRGRMNSLVDRGLILAQRGAYFSARAEFIQALRLATQTLDTAKSTHRHSEALAEAIAALEEAGDFIPSGAQLEANVDLELVISSHRTTILRGTDPQQLTALTAAQRYFALAQEKLGVACGGLPEASRALVGLGRIQEHLYDTTGDNRTLIGPRSMALYQSALVVDGKNFEAANELGVLLARYGQLEDAKQALLQGVNASSRPEIWRNLASVHETLGENDLANRARLEAEHALQFAQAQSELDAVRWISPEEMAAHGRGDTGLKKSQPRSTDSETPVAQKRPTAPWWAR